MDFGLNREKLSYSLEDRVVVVTGASRGLGEAIALACAQAGASVALAARTTKAILDLANKINSAGGRAIAITTDMTDRKQCRSLVGAAVREFGRLDVMINNAGIPLAGKPSLEVQPDEWRALIDGNLTSAFYGCQAAAEVMVEAGAGKIINMSSQFGSVGYPGRAAYCSAKGGVEQLTRALAAEWAPHGIQVNAIAPTHVETDFNSERVNSRAFLAEMLPKMPIGRLGVPEEVASVAVFLASSASDLITGHTLVVDGGWTAV
ncbi:MAG: SDR family NAD(P)-dependent oxidoreductase [Chloroflexi bacterium]|nr:SDR family NAD(P)-dependent oxidoreductase [Chloroflexota bacterium]MCY3936910.1 SDR family NAD(P)-dependent oxidoreductase [Chloroflexota bacterium]